MAKEAYYFSHDANARHDEKILELRAEYGWEGYGIYWAVIESLRDADGYKYNRKRLAGLALSLGVPKALLESVLFDFDLFRSDDEYVWSERLLRTMNKKEELSKERRDAIAKRWSKESETGKKENTNVIQNGYKTDTIVIQGKERKGKEIKEKEIEDKSSCPEIGISDEERLPEKPIPTEERLPEKPIPTEERLPEKPIPTEERLPEKPIPTEERLPEKPIPTKKEPSNEGRAFAQWFRVLLPADRNVSKTDLENWATTYDELIRIDERSDGDIRRVCKWAREDSFWKLNFLSPTKLRQKDRAGVKYFEVFKIKMDSIGGANGRSANVISSHEQLTDTLTREREDTADAIRAVKIALGEVD